MRKIKRTEMDKKRLASSIGYHTAEINRLRKELDKQRSKQNKVEAVMPRKKETPEQIILSSWEGSRSDNVFFNSLSDEAYLGYVTGMTIAQNPGLGIPPVEVFTLVKKLLMPDSK